MNALDGIIFLAVVALAVMLIRDGLRHVQQLQLGAALDRALAPQTLKAKYACVMSPAEIREMTLGRWQD